MTHHSKTLPIRIRDFLAHQTEVSWWRTLAAFFSFALIYIVTLVVGLHLLKPMFYEVIAPLRAEIWEDIPAGWALGLENGALVSNRQEAVRFDGGDFFKRLETLLWSEEFGLSPKEFSLGTEDGSAPALLVVDAQVNELSREDFAAYHSFMVLGAKDLYVMKNQESFEVHSLALDASAMTPLVEVASFEADYNQLIDQGLVFFDWVFIYIYVVIGFITFFWLFFVVLLASFMVSIWAYFAKRRLNFSSAFRFSVYAAGLPAILIALLEIAVRDVFPLSVHCLPVILAVLLAHWTLRK